MLPRVLIIEDDKDIRANIVSFLSEEGMIADELPDGDNLLLKLSQNHYDIILCDIMMPGKDGFELLEMLHKLFTSEQIPPFIFLSARTDEADKQKGKSLGAVDYITKPFRIKEVLTAIGMQLEKRRNGYLNTGSI